MPCMAGYKTKMGINLDDQFPFHFSKPKYALVPGYCYYDRLRGTNPSSARTFRCYLLRYHFPAVPSDTEVSFPDAVSLQSHQLKNAGRFQWLPAGWRTFRPDCGSFGVRSGDLKETVSGSIKILLLFHSFGSGLLSLAWYKQMYIRKAPDANIFFCLY